MRGSRIIVAPSAGRKLAGKQGVISSNGATKNQFRVLLDGSKQPITLHASFLNVLPGN